ncbi:MAG: hypothetical protein NXI22_12340 [bacterium]|nr:hypothetical protein [bacterium]
MKLAKRGTTRTRFLRRAVSTLDYVLVMCVALPLIALCLWAAPRIMNLVYEMTCVVISWPFAFIS